MEDNYITPDELREIADYCEALRPLWDALVSRPKGGVSVEHAEAPRLTVFDSNGDTLGFISWAEDGAAFYPTAGNVTD